MNCIWLICLINQLYFLEAWWIFNENKIQNCNWGNEFNSAYDHHRSSAFTIYFSDTGGKQEVGF